MGVFTRLGADELAGIATTFGLGTLVHGEAITAGTINSNFALETDRGRWFVRVNEGKAEFDVAWEARLIDALVTGGVPAPPPMPARDGRPYAALAGVRGKWVSVFPWRAGRHLAADEVTESEACELGVALARFHTVGAALPSAWRRGSIYDHDHLLHRYEHLAQQLDPQLARAIEVLGDELQLASDALPERRRAPTGIIHGDLFRDNVLWEDDRITAILDFEQASGGSLVYDVAVCINDWCWTDRPQLELVHALIAGYQSVRPLAAAERAVLPIEVRAAAARFTITRITDVYLARVHNPEKDFRAFLARVEAWRGPALGQLSDLL